MGVSQSRVAKMEAGDPHVSLDLMIRALLAAGMTRGELAEAMALPLKQQPLPLKRQAERTEAPSGLR